MSGEQTLDMRGRWDARYKDIDRSRPVPYGGDTTYKMAADFLADLDSVEDWGCGSGGFRQHFRGKSYVGVDGSTTPFADIVADLQTYRSNPDGILLRHVLEHNYDWVKVLENAVKSARRKICIVLFTPLGDTTTEIRHNRDFGVDVPDLSLSASELFARLGPYTVETHPDIPTDSQYGRETVILVTKNAVGGGSP